MEKDIMFLSRILAHLCMIIHYIAKKKTLLFTSSKTKLLKSHVNDWFKISGKQLTQMPKQVNVLDLKIMAKK